MKNLILVGGGGHCKSVIDIAECLGYNILGILDRHEEKGKRVLNYEIIGEDADMGRLADQAEFLVTVGQIKSPELRIRLHRHLAEAGCRLATIIAPTAHVSRYAKIGEGTVVMHQAVVNADAKVGHGCIINTLANIEHDTIIDDYCHISTGAMINGGARIEAGTFIGSQSVVNQGITICSEVVVASLSVVNRDITKKGVYAGTPAAIIK